MLTQMQTLVNQIGRVLGIIGMAVLVAMMLLTGIDVFLRYVFNRPILGSIEITELMMLTFAFAAIVWCTANKSHIKVDLISGRIPDSAKSISDIIFYIFYLVLNVFLAWRNFLEAMALKPAIGYAGGRTSILDILHYPFYLLIAVACALISIMLLIYIIQDIAQVVKRWT